MLLSAGFVPLIGIIAMTPTVLAQAAEWGQCGGSGYTGPTTCVSGCVCTYVNPYYSQCLRGMTTSTSSTISPRPSTSSTFSPQPSATSLAAVGKSIGWKYVGSATDGPQGLCSGDEVYLSILQEQFNMATTGTVLTWRAVEPEEGVFNFRVADQLVSWAARSNIMLRGQPLVWHAALPDWLNYADDMEHAIQTHVSNIITHFQDSMYAWDVVNEIFLDDGSYRKSIFYERLDKKFVEIAFRAARDASPSGKLYINEDLGPYPSYKVEALMNLVWDLSDMGIRVDGIGIQGHYVVGQVPSSLAADLKQLSGLGVEVAITELDVRMPLPATTENLIQQEKDYKAVFAACKTVQRCVGVSIWGVTDNSTWILQTYPGYGAPLPWDANYKLKPAYAGAVAGMRT